MDLLSIAKTVGSSIFSSVVPGGAAILTAVNAALPDEYKLSNSATGSQIESTLNTMPAELKAQIQLKQFDVDITKIKEAHNSINIMLANDAITPQTTRPKIAYGSFLVVGASILITVLVWSYAVISNNKVMVEAVMNGWPFLLSVITPLAILLRAYFGIISNENKSKVNGSIGTATQTGLINAIGSIMGKSK